MILALNLSEFNPWGMAYQKTMHSISSCADRLSGQYLHWYYSKMYLVRIICRASVCTGSVARCVVLIIYWASICWFCCKTYIATDHLTAQYLYWFCCKMCIALIICQASICTGSVAKYKFLYIFIYKIVKTNFFNPAKILRRWPGASCFWWTDGGQRTPGPERIITQVSKVCLWCHNHLDVAADPVSGNWQCGDRSCVYKFYTYM